MPGDKVSFLAFGQDHKDEASMVAVGEHLERLHTEFEKTGQKLVLAIEHSDADVKDAEAIRSLHNRAVMQIYLEGTDTPDFDQFYEANKSKLKGRETAAVSSETGLHEPSEMEMIFVFQDQQKVWKNDVNFQKGPARIQEAAILDWAAKHHVPVRGLDPVKDAEKDRLLTDSQGHIKGKTLQDMEYQRVQGMATKASELMKDISQEGGCVVAINMGTAHLASIEVAVREAMKRDGIEDAGVKVCVMVPPDRLSNDKNSEAVGDDMMRLSVNNIRKCHEPFRIAVESRQSSLEEVHKTLADMDLMVQDLTSRGLDEASFREALKSNPKALMDELNKEMAEDAELDEDDFMALAEDIKKEDDPSNAASTSTEVKNDPPTVATEKLKSMILETRQQVSTLIPKKERQLQMAKDDEQRHLTAPEMIFAQNVENRIAHKPEGAFKTFTPGTDGRYDLSALSQAPRLTVGESTGMRQSNSTRRHSLTPVPEVDTGDKSTRAQLTRSKSTSNLGDSLSDSKGGTTQKIGKGLS